MHTDARTQCTPAQNNKICLQLSSVCIVRARTCRGYAYYYESSQLYMNSPRAAYKQQYCTDQYDSVNINRHVRYEYFCTSRHLFVAVCIDDSTHSVRRHTFSATAHTLSDLVSISVTMASRYPISDMLRHRRRSISTSCAVMPPNCSVHVRIITHICKRTYTTKDFSMLMHANMYI